MPSTNASIKQDHLEHCPVIMAGCISPEILCHFENATATHFCVKNIPEERWVATVAFNMEDLLAINWLAVVGSKLLQMSWGEYLTTLCAKWLKKDWEHTAHRELLALEQGSKSFEDFSHMEKELAADCMVAKLYLINDFDDWLEAVTDLDEKHQHQLVIIAKELAKHNDHYPPRPHIPAVASMALCTTSSGVAKEGEEQLPCLTPKERELLKEHNGCYVCQQFYVYHFSTECPNGFPSKAFYKTLTLEMAKKAKKPRPVATIGLQESKDFPITDKSPTPTMATAASASIATVLPSCYVDDNTSWNSDLDGSLGSHARYRILSPLHLHM
ncbi:hypothetical protein BDN71DRAFT_1431400 [Pleurotus eryngii]|uniref:Uncharacterized protein n=1 Tax=Pleurotus eryngii TaxID=5323 RepID=A0A9P5ZUX7_PLEER|nr:hypothetical protein BDN71DRAFT_1431400 [Pleurotus eryngii]